MPYVVRENVLLAMAVAALLVSGCQSANPRPDSIEPAYSYRQDTPRLTHAEIWPVGPTGQRTAEWTGTWETARPGLLAHWPSALGGQNRALNLGPLSRGSRQVWNPID